jgi:Glycosyl hydrolases family 32 C terminal
MMLLWRLWEHRRMFLRHVADGRRQRKRRLARDALIRVHRAALNPVRAHLTVTPHDVRDYFGVLLKAASGLELAFGLVFEPGAQRVTITLWPQPLDPFWAKLTGQPVPPPQVDGPRLVEREFVVRDGEGISCRVIVTGSIVETFVNDSAALTYRIYDDHDFKPGLIVQDGGATFESIQLRTRPS